MPSREVVTFLAVGAAGYVVDVAAFNVLVAQPGRGGLDPTVAKVLAVAAAMVVTYLGNRLLTWHDRGRADDRRWELGLFVVFNLIGLGISVGMLVITHDVLGWTSRLADNLSANVVGLALGTAFRFWAYRRFVFPAPLAVASTGEPELQTGCSAMSRVLGGTRWPVALVATAASALWLPTLIRPLSADEGGFLLVASQWSPGTSLYGNYWVDRPPLLIGLFQLADLAGGRIALRLLGLVAIVASLLLAARIGRLASPGVRRAPVICAATAAVFLTTRLFGATEVDGELLAVPWVLLSVYATLRSTTPPGDGLPRSWRPRSWPVLAGGSAAAALLVKQSMAEGFVFAAVVVGWLALAPSTTPAAGYLATFALGASAVLALALTWAWLRGTSPLGLWDAVVVFRADATAVISGQADGATPHRAAVLTGSFLASGALLLLAAAFLPVRRGAGRPRTGARRGAETVDVRLLAAAVLLWEIVAVASGGSYWLHYLIGTVPGLVLAVAAVTTHHPARSSWPITGLAYAAAVGVVATIGGLAHDGTSPGDAVATYLAARAQPGDTAVVAFGNPAILRDAAPLQPVPRAVEPAGARARPQAHRLHPRPERTGATDLGRGQRRKPVDLGRGRVTRPTGPRPGLPDRRFRR